MKRLHEFPNATLAAEPDTVYVWLERSGGVTVIGRHAKDHIYAERLEPGMNASHLAHCVSAVTDSINREFGGEDRLPCILRFESEIII